MIATIPRLVCEQHEGSAQWSAWREGNPFRRASGDHPAAAVRRFVEMHFEGETDFELSCDRDLAGDGEFQCRMRWAPPDLLLKCSACHGSGMYVGLLTRESCTACEGAGTIKVLC